MEEFSVRVSKERKALLARYAQIAVNHYGVLTFDKFVDFFNHYEPDLTNIEEAQIGLTRYAKTTSIDLAGFRVDESYVFFSDLQRRNSIITKNSKKTMEIIIKTQRNATMFFPDKESLLALNPLEVPILQSKNYNLALEYLKSKTIIKKNPDFSDYENLLLYVFSKNIALGQPFIEATHIFSSRLNPVIEKRTLKHFIKLLINIYENTNRFIDFGHSIAMMRIIKNEPEFEQVIIDENLIQQVQQGYDYQENTAETTADTINKIIRIVDYIHTATNLYGVITLEDFTKFFNRYEPYNPITILELDIVLKHSIIGRSDIEFVMVDNFLIHEIISPLEQKEPNDKLHLALLLHQSEMPSKYFPPVNMAISMGKSLFFDYEIAYTKFKNIIIQNKLIDVEYFEMETGEKISNIDIILYRFSLFIKCGLAFDHIYKYLNGEYGIDLNKLTNKNKKNVEIILSDIYHNTRMFSLNGYTINEVEEFYEDDDYYDDYESIDSIFDDSMRKSPIKVVKNTNNKQRVVEKIGRNDPCFCGSEKKYKKCCEDRSHLKVVK